jgi:hypothetical protein
MIFTDQGGLCTSQRWLPMPMVSCYSLIDFKTIFLEGFTEFLLQIAYYYELGVTDVTTDKGNS